MLDRRRLINGMDAFTHAGQDCRIGIRRDGPVNDERYSSLRRSVNGTSTSAHTMNVDMASGDVAVKLTVRASTFSRRMGLICQPAFCITSRIFLMAATVFDRRSAGGWSIARIVFNLSVIRKDGYGIFYFALTGWLRREGPGCWWEFNLRKWQPRPKFNRALADASINRMVRIQAKVYTKPHVKLDVGPCHLDVIVLLNPSWRCSMNMADSRHARFPLEH
jgi:hypothetical protein